MSENNYNKIEIIENTQIKENQKPKKPKRKIWTIFKVLFLLLFILLTKTSQL